MKPGDLSEMDPLSVSPNGEENATPQVPEKKRGMSSGWLLVGGVAVGILVGLAVTSLWLVRRSSDRNVPPLQRAEHLIKSCEDQIQKIEKALESLRTT
ncbi:MAG: hypothetical protein RMK49_12915 [Abditibacteriales bacterium]|nr:hypothetical protein [Abditibacteriales bacterium]